MKGIARPTNLPNLSNSTNMIRRVSPVMLTSPSNSFVVSERGKISFFTESA